MANGKFSGGDGTALNPFLIEDALDLDAIRKGVDKCYKLIKNINLGVAPFNQGKGWIPINNTNSGAICVIDGNGHIIKNLYINNPTLNNLGLLGDAYNITVKNLIIKDGNIIGNNSGGIIGNSNFCSMINCCYMGNITGDNAGGLIGRGWQCSIKNSHFIGNIIGNGVGGLASSFHNSQISNSYFIGNLTGSGVGGLIYASYENTARISNSFWDTDISKIALPTSPCGGTGKTTAEMKTPSTFVGWENEKSEDGKPVWILKNGQYPKLWFEKPPIKFLLKQNDNLYTFNGTDLKLSPSQVLDDANFKTNGFDDDSLITKEQLAKSFTDKTGLKLLSWTDDLTKINMDMVYNCDPFRPLDKFDKSKPLEIYKSIEK